MFEDDSPEVRRLKGQLWAEVARVEREHPDWGIDEIAEEIDRANPELGDRLVATGAQFIKMGPLVVTRVNQ